MSDLGWRYDAWLTTPPDDPEEEQDAYWEALADYVDERIAQDERAACPHDWEPVLHGPDVVGHVCAWCGITP